jgi:ECF sigma factor
MPANTVEINLLIDRYRDGQSDAFEKLMSLVYDDLGRIAAWQLKSERPDHMLQPTALVHEAFLRLAGQNPIN